jgi:uncharacterized protein (TIGR03067 family)
MMNRLLFWILFPAVVLSCLARSKSDDPKKANVVEAELKRFSGEWRIVAAELGGEAAESKDLVAFSGLKCTITNPITKVKLENTITIDPLKTPKQIAVTNIKTKETWVGIYELKGDQLRAVFQGQKGGKRPAEFKTRKGSQEVMYSYERIMPEAKKQP